MFKHLYCLFWILILAIPLHLKAATPAQPQPAQQAVPSTPSPTPPQNDLFEQIRQTPQETDHFFYDFLNMLMMLGLIVLFILIVSWLLKRFMNTRMQQINSASPIKILERRSLTPKTAIYLLEVHGKGIIIAESQNGVSHLGNIHLTPEEKV